MKYEWKTAKITIPSGEWNLQAYSNTPHGCMTDEDDGGGTILHPGLNLTDSGEWIPAPGFESRGAAERCCEYLARAEKAEAKLDAIEKLFESWGNRVGSTYGLVRTIGTILRGES